MVRNHQLHCIFWIFLLPLSNIDRSISNGYGKIHCDVGYAGQMPVGILEIAPIVVGNFLKKIFVQLVGLHLHSDTSK